MRQGETWDTAVERLYSDVTLRRDISGLLEPTAHLMSCHLLAMALMKMTVDAGRRALAGALDVERTRAESRLEVVRSRYRVPAEVLFSEIHAAFQERPASPEMASVWPLLLSSATEMLQAASALDTLCSRLEREFGRLLQVARLPGQCPSAADAGCTLSASTLSGRCGAARLRAAVAPGHPGGRPPRVAPQAPPAPGRSPR